nr:MAG TPA: hypothetical protein [Bacteriophage sp.]
MIKYNKCLGNLKSPRSYQLPELLKIGTIARCTNG